VDLITHKSAPEMPFEEAKLAEGEIAAIVKWIDLGAAYDKPLNSGDDDETPWTERVIDPAARTYWAFQPLLVADPPAVSEMPSFNGIKPWSGPWVRLCMSGGPR
jgi:hypothetical protein